MQNNRSFIAYLPAEILSRVFRLVVDPRDRVAADSTEVEARSLFSIDEVSTQWNTIARNNPTLWGAIFQVDVTATLFNTISQRAGSSSPISFVFSTDVDEHGDAFARFGYRNFRRVLQMAHRWSYVHIYHNGESIWDKAIMREVLLNPGPMLQYLSIDCSESNASVFQNTDVQSADQAHDPRNEQSGAFRTLQYVGPVAHDALVLGFHSPAFSSLTKLILQTRETTYYHNDHDVIPFKVAESLRNLVNLEVLALQNLINWTEGAVYVPTTENQAFPQPRPPPGFRPIDFPRLRRLELFDEFFACSHFLPLLSLPRDGTCIARVHCTGKSLQIRQWDKDAFRVAFTSLLSIIPGDIEFDTLSLGVGNHFHLRLEKLGALQVELKAHFVRYGYENYIALVSELQNTLLPHHIDKWSFDNLRQLKLKAGPELDREVQEGRLDGLARSLFYRSMAVHQLHLYGAGYLVFKALCDDQFRRGTWATQDSLPNLQEIVISAFSFLPRSIVLDSDQVYLNRALQARSAKTGDVSTIGRIVVIDDVTGNHASRRSFDMIDDRGPRILVLNRDIIPHFAPWLNLTFDVIAEAVYLEGDTGYWETCSYCSMYGAWYAEAGFVDFDLRCDCFWE